MDTMVRNNELSRLALTTECCEKQLTMLTTMSDSLQMTPAAAAAKTEILQGFSKLLETGQGSDLTITCKSKTFKAHSAIIASRSPFFAAACWSGFKQEAETHCIDLPDDDPTAVWTMLRYLYASDYTIEPRTDFLSTLDQCPLDANNRRRTSSLHLVCNASMYGMGEKYGIDGLKGIAAEKFAATLRQPEWHDEWTRQGSDVCVGALATAVKCVYDSTPESDRGLREQVLAYAEVYLGRLLVLEDFKVLLEEVPKFAYQLLVGEAEGRREVGMRAKKRGTASRERTLYELLGEDE